MKSVNELTKSVSNLAAIFLLLITMAGCTIATEGSYTIDAEAVTADKNALEITFGGSDSAGSVTQNIILSTSGFSGTTIAWESDTPSVIAADGDITRPASGSGDATVILTATISKNGASDTKQFTLTVIALRETDEEAVAAAKAALEIIFARGDTIDMVRQDITLATEGVNGITISWLSNNTDVIQDSSSGNPGSVTRPLSGTNAAVTLTATIVKNDISDTVDFILTVLDISILSSDSTLSNLSAEPALIETFSSGTTSYSAWVVDESIIIILTAADGLAEITTVENSSTSTNCIEVLDGAYACAITADLTDIIVVTVTSEDSTTTDYTIEVTDGIVPLDANEYNDDIDSATLLTIGEAAEAATIHVEDDPDYYQFTVTDTSVGYVIDATINADFDQYISLIDTDKTTILINEQDEDYGNSGSERIRGCIFSSPGTYYILLGSYNNDDIGSYEIKIYPLETDEYEPNNDIDSATLLTIGEAAEAATIHHVDDLDYYQFIVTDTSVGYVIDATINADFDQYISLIDNDRETIIIDKQDNDDEGDFGPERINGYIFSSTGTYYILLESYQNEQIGSYEIIIYTIEADGNESNDVLGDATPLTVNAPSVFNTIHIASDVDYFSFYVDTTGVEYTLNPSINSTFDQNVWLYNTDGTTPLIENQDNDNGIGPDAYYDSETITYTFSATGTYFFFFYSLENVDTGIYDVQITKP